MDEKRFKELTKIYDEDFEKNKMNVPKFEDLRKKQIPCRFMFFKELLKNGDIVLDCGCYSGYMMYILSNMKDIDIHGIDISERAIYTCRHNSNILYNNVKHCAIENIDYDENFFDVTIASQVIEHVDNPAVAIKEMLRVTKDKGKVVVSIPIMRNMMDKLHLHFFNFYDVMDLFDQFGYEYKIYKYHKTYKGKIPNIYIIVMVKGVERTPDDNKKEGDEE